VTFGGFLSNTFLNAEFIEGPTSRFSIQGRESYWSASGKLFLYYCRRFKKWRIADIEGYRQIRGGQCYGHASQKASNVEILDAKQPRGWMEVSDGKWTLRRNAGVDDLSTLKEKMDALDAKAAAEKAASETQSADEVLDDEDDLVSGVSPAWMADKKGPMCPLRPAYETVKETAKEVAKSTYRWVKSMLPMLLGAPENTESSGDDSASSEVGASDSSEHCNTTEPVKST